MFVLCADCALHRGCRLVYGLHSYFWFAWLIIFHHFYGRSDKTVNLFCKFSPSPHKKINTLAAPVTHTQFNYTLYQTSKKTFPSYLFHLVDYFSYIKSLAIIMLYGNSFTNPIIYSICNEQFRTGFKDLFGSCLQPCSFLMKITGLAKSDPDRTFSRNDCLSAREESRTGDRQKLTIDNNQRETPKQEFERSDSVCSQRCAFRHKPREMLAACEPDKDDAAVAYVSAV